MDNPLADTTDTVRSAAIAERAMADARVLLARAKALAREDLKPVGTDTDTFEVLEFGLSNESYAFELAHVREVLPLIELTPLPRVPPHILGVAHARGQIIAVVDLRRIFHLPERGLLNSWQMIVLQSARMEFAVLAERIVGVRRLPVAGLQASLPNLTDVRAAYLKGIAPDGTVVLSALRLLTDPQLMGQ
jgi:purine-binding chemotaxis protein CheW